MISSIWFIFIKNAMAIAASTAKKFSKGKKWRIFSIKSIIKHKTSIDWIHLPWRTNRFWCFNSLDFLFAAVHIDLITKTFRYLWHFYYYPNIDTIFHITVWAMHLSLSLSIDITFHSEWICFMSFEFLYVVNMNGSY